MLGDIISLNEQYLKDHRIIQEEFLPVVHALDEKGVNEFSFCMFFATYLKEILKTMDDDRKKEAIIRCFMDR